MSAEKKSSNGPWWFASICVIAIVVLILKGHGDYVAGAIFVLFIIFMLSCL